MPKTFYELGNDLRGFYSGEFESDDEAWEVLSDRFNRAFPSLKGRHVHMKKGRPLWNNSGWK